MENTIGMTDRQFRCIVGMIQLELKHILQEESAAEKDKQLSELIGLMQTHLDEGTGDSGKQNGQCSHGYTVRNG